MSDTALAAPDAWFDGERPKVDRIAEVRLPKEQRHGMYEFVDP